MGTVSILGPEDCPTAPVLVYPDSIRPFLYAMDASDIAVGTVL